MKRSLIALAGSATLAAAHGILDSVIIDGTTYVLRIMNILTSGFF